MPSVLGVKMGCFLLIAVGAVLCTLCTADGPCDTSLCSGCNTTHLDCHYDTQQVNLSAIPMTGAIVSLSITCDGSLLTSTSDLMKYPGLQHLKIRGCDMRILRANAFSKLKNLISLIISGNEIYATDATAFSDLKVLEVLDMSSNNLSELPVFKDLHGLVELDLSNNLISAINGEAFMSTVLLRSINLAINKIKDWNINAFAKLAVLEHVNMSNNALTVIPESVSGLPLHTLDLSGNFITQIQHFVFNLQYIESIYLQGNRITRVNATTFSPTLKILHLQNNAIQQMSEIFVGALNMSQLKHLYIGGNAFHCNCKTMPLRQFVHSHTHLFNMSDKDSMPWCNTPSTFPMGSMGDVYPCSSPMVNITNGKDNIRCEVYGDPTPRVSWLDLSGHELTASGPSKDISQTNISLAIALNKGKYTCKAVNDFGDVSEMCIVFEKDAPLIIAPQNPTEKFIDQNIDMKILIGAVVGAFVFGILLTLLIVLCAKKCSCCNRSKPTNPTKFVTWNYVSNDNNKKKQRKQDHEDHLGVPPHFHHSKRGKSKDKNQYAEIPANKRPPKNNSVEASKRKSSDPAPPPPAINAVPSRQSPVPTTSQYANLEPPNQELQYQNLDPQRPIRQQITPVPFKRPVQNIFPPPRPIDFKSPGSRAGYERSSGPRTGFDRIRYQHGSSDPRPSTSNVLSVDPFGGVNFKRTRSFGGYGSELDV